MSDLISRQAAIDALKEAFNPSITNFVKAKIAIDNLPSAQPEKRTEERTETHACDCISRQMLLEYIHDEPVGRLLCDKYNLDGLIEQFPSAQQWIPCSERLPEKAEGQYWVCTNTGYQCQCRWTDDVYGLGSNGKWTWKIFDIPQYSHVVAWMPLPEAYKEDDHEG